MLNTDLSVLRKCGLLLTALVLPCIGQTDDLPSKLDQVANAYRDNRSFMGSVLVAKGGKILLEKGYGMADLEWDLPNAPDVKFRLGSMTKQFTAAAILLLAQDGKLSVEDSACKYFDGCPEAWKAITIHQLLSHTSGIPSYTDEKNFGNPKSLRLPMTPTEIVLLSKDKPLDFEPGTKWKYDNSGYVFLGSIIEKVSGEKFEGYLKKHIFEPLGMKDTGYDQTAAVLKHRASGYQSCGSALCNSDYIDMSLPYAAGALYSTVGDLYRWDRALNTDNLLRKESRDRMFTPVMHEYGYGWMLGPMANHKHEGHGGAIPGFSTYIARFPAEDASVIVLSNNMSSNAQPIADALAGTLFGEKVSLPRAKKQVVINPELLDRYTGNWQVGPMQLAITKEEGRLMVQPKGQPKFEAFSSSETEFFLKPVDAVLAFTPTETGRAVELRLELNGSKMNGKRAD